MSLWGYRHKWGKRIDLPERVVLFPVKKKIKPASSCREKQYREYVKLRKPFLEANPICACCGHATATEVHHSHGRTGRLLLYVPLWFGLCAGCHFWVTNHTTEARARWLTCPEGQWNDQSKIPKTT